MLCQCETKVSNVLVSFFNTYWHFMCIFVKAGTHLRWGGNTKPKLYVFYVLSTNRNKPCLLPHLDIPINWWICVIHEETASGWCAVPTTQTEAVSCSFIVASLQVYKLNEAASACVVWTVHDYCVLAWTETSLAYCFT